MLLSKEKKEQLIRDYEAFWDHKLERPIINITLNPGQTAEYNPITAKVALLKSVYDFNKPIKEIVEEYRKSFEKQIYLGDGFPTFYLRPTSCLGGMIGEPYSFDETNGTIWFEEIKKDIKDLHITLDRNAPIYKRGIELYKALMDEFKDDLAVGVPDFGGVMDIYSSIRTSGVSLTDLYDYPEEVERINEEIYQAYEEAYKDFNKIITENSKLGYTAWITLLSQKPYSTAQCDAICMVSKKQAEKFIIPVLERTNQLQDRCFYHLDGPTAVRHLDRLNEIDFNGIQWVNGAGAAPYDDEKWTEIYKKTLEAGKLLQIFVYSKEELRFIDHLYNLFGTLKNIAFLCYGREQDREFFEAYLDKYGCPR